MCSARYADMSKLRAVIELLLTGVSLSRELGDHPLKGEWKASRHLLYRTGLGADLPRRSRRGLF